MTRISWDMRYNQETCVRTTMVKNDRDDRSVILLKSNSASTASLLYV